MSAGVAEIGSWVEKAVAQTKVYDLHTHLYPANFGGLCLWGIDELVNYHYLIAETMRVSRVPYEKFWSMDKRGQNDLIWEELFVNRAPISEACRGVITVLQRLGLPIGPERLGEYREYFSSLKAEDYISTVFKAANVHTVVMTNDVFDAAEREIWLRNPQRDPRFKAVLRIDPLLQGWPGVAGMLKGQGYEASADMGSSTMKEVRRFLNDWIERLGAIYVAVSLTPEFRYPDESATTKVIRECILPITRERNIPFAMMIGVRRQVNARLKLAGDAVGKADIGSIDRICAENPGNKFLFTMLSRENQHELAVTARKHRNLMLFGCWWFLNNPVLIEEMTRMRSELLGTSFVPQHSDARILDQIIYKWDHSRAIIAKVMKDKFNDIAAAGWPVKEEQVKETADRYLNRNFAEFLERALPG